VLLETYAANDCVNQLLLQHVDARAWCGSPESKDKDPRLPEFSPSCTTIACPRSKTRLPA
jgi:hypothetical protein